MIENNPECKRCGLLRSTVLGTGKLCVGLSTTDIPPHDFGDSQPEEKEVYNLVYNRKQNALQSPEIVNINTLLGSWEAQFRQTFAEYANHERLKEPAYINWAVDFISNLLSSQRNIYENCPQCTGLREEYKDKLVKIVEGMMVKNVKDIKSMEGMNMNGENIKELVKRACGTRQNNALADLLEKLKDR